MKNKEKKIKVAYAEPDDYFPEEIRKKYKLGEYAEPENEEYLEDCGGIQPDPLLPEDGMVELCGGIPMEVAPMLEDDKAPSKSMSEQKTIHEKWEEGGITILPPKKD